MPFRTPKSITNIPNFSWHVSMVVSDVFRRLPTIGLGNQLPSCNPDNAPMLEITHVYMNESGSCCPLSVLPSRV